MEKLHESNNFLFAYSFGEVKKRSQLLHNISCAKLQMHFTPFAVICMPFIDIMTL